MKQFSCGDVVPGCKRTFRGTEPQILADVAAHAAADHGLTSLSDDVVDAVEQHITAVDAAPAAG